MSWRFEEFVRGALGNEKGIISDDLDIRPKAELDVILTEHLGIRPAHQWCAPDCIPIGQGMHEIRWNCNKTEYRAYGSFGQNAVFRIWIIATKSRTRKGKQKTDPPNAIEKARKRKSDFELHHIGKVREYD
jgi:hypothetical protein